MIFATHFTHFNEFCHFTQKSSLPFVKNDYSEEVLSLSFWDRLVALCEAEGTTPTAVTNSLGIASGSVTRWKNGGVPRDTTLLKLARYFDVSIAYLKGVELEPKDKPLSEQGAELLAIFEQLSVVGKAKLLVFAEELRKGDNG